jgi:antiviral helicase SKI2
MIKRSFSESQKQKLAQQFRDQLKRAETMLLDIEDLTCDSQPKCDIRNYYSLNRQEQSLMEQAQKFILTSTYAGQYLVAGRIVLVTSKDHKLTNKVGAVLKVATAGMAGTMSMSSNFSSSSNQEKKVTVFVLTGKASPILKEQYTVLELPLTDVSLICKAKIKVDVTQVLLRDNKDEIKATVKQIEDVQIESAPAQPAGLDPIKDMKIKDLEFVEIFNQIKTCQSAKEKSKCHTCPSLNKQINKMDKLARVEVQVDNMRHLLSEDSLILMPEFKQRVQVLKTLGYLNKDNIVQIKGRVAREMNTVDELLATEMIFENVLTLLEPAEIAALLSCLVFEEKSEVQIEIPERLEEVVGDVFFTANTITNSSGCRPSRT